MSEITAQIIVLASFGFMGIGLGLIIVGFIRSSKKIKEQQSIISEQEEKIRIIRERNPKINDIPNIVDKMRNLFSQVVNTKSTEVVDQSVLFEVFLNWASKAGVWTFIVPKKSSPVIAWVLWFYLVLIQILPKLKLKNGRLFQTLYWLSGEMDEQNIGIKYIKDTPEYIALLSRLDKARRQIGRLELNQSIEKYIQYSYNMNSFFLLIKYIVNISSNYSKFIPRKYSLRIDQFGEAINISMNLQRTEIVKQIELFYIGK